MLRRTLAAAAAAVSAALVTVPLASPTQAAEGDSCTFSPPAKIAIFRDVTSLTPSLSGTCTQYDEGYGFWYIDPAHPEDEVGGVAGFDPEDGAFLGIFDTSALGTLTWYPNGAGTSYYEDYCDESSDLRKRDRKKEWRTKASRVTGDSSREAVTASGARTDAEPSPSCDTDLYSYQNAPHTVVKLASAPYLTASRSGNKVTLNVTSNTWSPNADRFFAHAMGGELQIQNANGTWSRLGSPFVTASNGKRSYSFTLPGARTFRYAIYSTGYSWDKVSTAVRR